MGFGDLSRPEGLESLNNFLLTRSYIDGFQPSQADAVVFDAISKDPDSKYINVLRWLNHIKSFGDQRKKFPGQAKNVDSYGPPCTSTPAPEDDDDDVDLFGSDDEEKADENSAKKGIKVNKPIAKSLIVLDVKPWDDETDMTALEQAVRSIETDGLLWGTSKLVPLFQDLKKLQITCVVEDDKVGTDFLEEEIVKFDQYVQSVDIAAFNKL